MFVYLFRQSLITFWWMRYVCVGGGVLVPFIMCYKTFLTCLLTYLLIGGEWCGWFCRAVETWSWRRVDDAQTLWNLHRKTPRRRCQAPPTAADSSQSHTGRSQATPIEWWRYVSRPALPLATGSRTCLLSWRQPRRRQWYFSFRLKYSFSFQLQNNVPLPLFVN